MPRPTPAQFAYGSVTVICSTLAMLLLSRAPSGPGVAVIAVAALVLGVVVALTAPRASFARRAARTGAGVAQADPTPARSATAASRVHARHDVAASATSVRAARSAHRVAEPSLRP
ncbi:MAG TPA: hypothetical protein VGO89_01535 [Streptomyces sp.]|nr:hypothetical protein [Streptomyces sp.]